MSVKAWHSNDHLLHFVDEFYLNSWRLCRGPETETSTGQMISIFQQPSLSKRGLRLGTPRSAALTVIPTQTIFRKKYVRHSVAQQRSSLPL
jgi:hypothetical protein